MSKAKAAGGITVGSALATALSYHTNHSVVYAVFHFFFSWVYVIYWFLEYGSK